MKPPPVKIIYTILADDRPIAAIEATGIEARQLLRERWFAEELASLKVGGEPIYKSSTRLRTRASTEDEWAIYDQEAAKTDDPEDLLVVYLVDLDRA